MPDENGLLDPQEFSVLADALSDHYATTWDYYLSEKATAAAALAQVDVLEATVEARDEEIEALQAHDATHHVVTDSTAPTVPGKPTGVSNSPGLISLVWSPSTDASGQVRYAVYMDNSSTPILNDLPENTGVVSGLIPGIAHVFTVKARDLAGNTSAASQTSASVVVKTAPTTRKPMPVGVIIGTACGNLNTVTADYGSRPRIRRYFSSEPFDDIDNNPSVAADMGTIDRVISYKASQWTNTVRNNALRCFNSIPKDGRRTWIFAQNEPERGDKNDFGTGASNAAGANFVEYITEFIDWATDWVLDNDRVEDVGFGWAFSYYRLKTDPSIVNWLPHSENNKYATLGIQSYNPQPQNNQTLRMQTEPGVDRWNAVGGTKFALSEVNAKNGFKVFSERDPRQIPSPYNTAANAIEWWGNQNSGLPWAKARGCEFATIYLDNVGQDKPWCIPNDEVRNYLGSVFAASANP